MTLNRLLLVLISLFLINACVKQPVVPPGSHQKQTRQVGDFSALSLNGRINTVIKRVNGGTGLIVEGDSRDMPYVRTKVVNDQLFLSVDSNYPKFGPLKATVSMTQLNGLTSRSTGFLSGKNLRSSMMDILLDGTGNVTLSGQMGVRKLFASGHNTVKINGISSSYLDIILRENANVRLQGFAKLREVHFDGKGKLGLFWINSPKLIIRGGGDATVHLAGVSDFLVMNLYGNAEMDGQYFRVKKAYVKTFGRSLARLQPIKELNAYAADKSNIYYYSKPEFKAAYMFGEGAVLDLHPFWF